MDKLLAMTCFVRVAEKGSLTAAAAALNTSLPSVARALAALERDLGVRLLNRTTRRIHLTDEGNRYLERCRGILSAVQDAEAEVVSGQAEPQGRLAVTASIMFGRRYVAPIVSEFLRRYPKVSAEVLLVDRVVNLIEEGLDVAIRIGYLSDSSLVATPVGQVRRVVCATPQYLRRHGVPRTPEDLRKYRCIRHVGTSPRNEWQFQMGRRRLGVPITCVITCNDIDCSLSACADGIGLGMFLSYQAAPYIKSGMLRYVLEKFETGPLPIQVVHPHSRLLSSKVRAFVDACVRTLRSVAFDR
jgi:DNA-binding transcriptional LysR family regulator